MAHRAEALPDEKPDLVYARFNHPNAKFWRTRSFRSRPEHAQLWCSIQHGRHHDGAAHLRASGQSIIYTVPIYGGTQHLIEDFLETLGIHGIPVRAGRTAEINDAIRSASNLAVVLIETPANPTIIMTSIREAVTTAAGLSSRPVVMVDNTLLGPRFNIRSRGARIYACIRRLSTWPDSAT